MESLIVNKKTFDVKVENEVKKFCVIRPDSKLQAKAQLFKAKKIRESADGGALLREEVEKLLRERKIWDDDKELLYKTYVTSIREDENKLHKAKSNKMKLNDVKDLSLKIASTFQLIQNLQSQRNSLDNLTAEGIAASAEFDYLLAHCTKHEDGTAYYVDYDDMAERESCPVYDKAKEAFLDLLYGPYEEELKKRPEWKFLLKHKFVNEKLQLIDKEGNLVDGIGRKVDEKGRLINSDGKLVNDKGELVDDLGFLIPSDEGYYTDDEGNEIKE